ncbi:hypothetical protein Aperf_G00000046702 [Anoplocephala perfoliata]
MNPNGYNFNEDQDKNEFVRQSRSHESEYRPEPELMDECANQEAPPVPTTFQFIPTTEQGNTMSSGYFSGPPGSLQGYGEEIHPRDPVESLGISSLTPRILPRRNVRFAEDIRLPPPKRFKQWDSSYSIKVEESQQEMVVSETSLKEAQEFKPSLLRSATVPFSRPVQMASKLFMLSPLRPHYRASYCSISFVPSGTILVAIGPPPTRDSDCRFPYEYEAGHIRDAINVYTSSDVVREVFMNVPAVSPDNDENFVNLGPLLSELLSGENPDVRLPRIKGYIPRDFPSDVDDSDSDDDVFDEDPMGECGPSECEPGPSTSVAPVEADPTARPAHAIVFHCEFSSQRGPALARFIRKLDRYLNYSRYPHLFYPYVYVMIGGYAAFYEKYPELCEPQSYLKMYQRGFRNQLQYFNKLTKEVSDVCGECFRNPRFVNLTISPKMEKKEEKPALRSVRTMLLGSQMQRMEEFFEKSMANEDEVVIEPSVERNVINREHLQLAEHIVRRGNHVTVMYEQIRQMNMASPAKRREALAAIPADSTFSDSDDERGRGYGPSRSGTRSFAGPRPVALLTYSDDDIENDENRPPGAVFTGPFPRGKLNFSDYDDETPNNSSVFVHL